MLGLTIDRNKPFDVCQNLKTESAGTELILRGRIQRPWLDI
jgi:hypothetical protein